MDTSKDEGEFPQTSLDGSVSASIAMPIPTDYLTISPASTTDITSLRRENHAMIDNSPDADSSPRASTQWANYGMDNSQQAILSEEALLLHTTDIFSLQSPYFNQDSPNSSTFSHAHSPSGSATHVSPTGDQNQFQSTRSSLPLNKFNPDMNSGVGSESYEHLNRPQFSNSLNAPGSQIKVENGDQNNEESLHALKEESETKAPRSPTMLEAAAMAAEIIASENNTGNTTKKPRPCDSCRRRKARCIMLPSHTGRCLHCEVKKQSCTFLEAPVRRNRNKKNSIPNVAKSNSTVSNDNTSDNAENSLVEVEGRTGLYGLTQPDNGSTLQLRYEDYASLGGHALLKKALSLQYPRSSYFIGPTSVYDTKLLEATPLDSQGRALLVGDIELRKVSNDVMFSLKNDYSEALYKRSIQNVDAVEHLVAPHGRMLIDLYFRTVHPSFPILHKKVFIEKYKRTHREFIAPLLAAVYILALNWWNYDPALSSLPKPDVNALFNLGLHTFVDALDRPKLSSVQAGILLLQCQPSHNRSWMLCSQVVALTEELGIGLDSGKWRLPRWERGLRRRLAWAVWLQDKWLSVSEARPSHIDRLRTWHIKHLTADDFPERDESEEEGSAEVESSRILFMEFIKLTEIVEDMTDDLFTVRSVRLLVQTEKILEEIKPLQIRLRNWYHNLQPQLSMSVSRPRKLSSNGYLHLAYFATEITLHRRIVRSLTNKSPPMLAQICREAAKTRLIAAMEFVRNLRPEHLQAFWYSSAASSFALIGSFAALLYVTASTPEEAAFYKAKLSDYRWVLRVSANGFEPMAGAMRLLDIALCRVPQLLEDQSLGDPLIEDGVGTSLGGKADDLREKRNNERKPIDDNEEGDGEEDFTSETPRYDNSHAVNDQYEEPYNGTMSSNNNDLQVEGVKRSGEFDKSPPKKRSKS